MISTTAGHYWTIATLLGSASVLHLGGCFHQSSQHIISTEKVPNDSRWQTMVFNSRCACHVVLVICIKTEAKTATQYMRAWCMHARHSSGSLCLAGWTARCVAYWRSLPARHRYAYRYQKIRKIRIEKGTIMVFCFAFSDAIVIYPVYSMYPCTFRTLVIFFWGPYVAIPVRSS